MAATAGKQAQAERKSARTAAASNPPRPAGTVRPPRVILLETASRFARDLAVQLAGHDLLKARGIELIPVDAPEHFQDETPTAIMVRQILGAVAQFEKASLVQKLRHALERMRAEAGRCEGRKPVPEAVVREARRPA